MTVHKPRSLGISTVIDHELRDSMILALAESSLREGKGSSRQQAAYQELEWRRCAASCRYFLDNYGHIILKDGTLQRWSLWPVQIELLEAWSKHESVVAIKARQLGITTLSAHFALWECIFKPAARWMLVSASEEKAKDIISRVQATKDRLPQWMTERASNRDRDPGEHVRRGLKSDAMTRISFGLSEMKIVTSTSKSIQGASGSFIVDEFTEHTEQKRKLHMLLPAIDGGGMAIIIANGKGEDEFFHLYQAAKRKENRFTPFFFSWRGDPSRTQEWYDDMQRQFCVSNPEADEFAFKAQFPSDENEAFYISGNSRFRISVINAQMEAARARGVKPESGVLEAEGTSYTIEPKGTGRWKVWERPQKGASYVIGIDSSGGSQSGDWAVIQVFKVRDEHDIEQVAVFRAKVESTELAYEGVKAGHWYNDAYVVPEANNTGQLLIDRMKPDYFNIYMRRSKVDRFTTTASPDNIGFWTDRSSKPRIIGQLAEYLNRDWITLCDSTTIAELVHYEISDDGVTTNAPKGMSDDCVMATALAVEGAIDQATFFAGAQVRTLMPWEE